MAGLGNETKLLYDAVLLFGRILIWIFFREIRPRGAFNIPREGPVIFVGAPHHNQFLDPLLLSMEVYRETGRRVQFLAAAASMRRKDIGLLIRMLASIPVERAADNATAGIGRIYLSPSESCTVLGDGTRFKEELSPKMQLMLPKSVGYLVAEVSEVISDTELRIKKEFGGDSGKGSARVREKVEELRKDGQVGFEFKKMPFINQQDMYREVYQCLKDGSCMGIFPEGGSHDRTDLLPFKAGVSVMALGAMANDPNCKVKIVPVGLSYFHPHRFRSRAVVEFGSAIDVPPEFVDMFKQGGPSKREAVSRFLNLIFDVLKTVTVVAPDYDTLMLVQAVRRLYKTPGQHLTLGQVVELNRRFLRAYVQFKDEPRVQKLRADVLKYNRLLRDLGLRDHQVPRAQKAGWKTLGLLIYRIGLLLVWTVFALPGTILNGPIFILASIWSRKKAKEALANSIVKVQGRDVLATWKILISLGVAPVLYTAYAVIATVIAFKANVPLRWKLWTPVLVSIALPFMNYAALKFGEAGVDVLKSLRPLIVTLLPGQQKLLDEVKFMRERLSNEVAQLINDFGPKLYNNFDEWRIVPSSSVPPATSTNGGVDPQGSLLIHPMTWLDERLFGWSRSSIRGKSAWAGGASGHDVSGTVSPDGSDDEDGGDYDDVLGYIPGEDQPGYRSPPKSRSRATSYADLQRLRMQGTGDSAASAQIPHPSVASSDDSEGLHLRQRRGNDRNDILHN